MRLVNPHSYVYFDSTDENGVVVNLRCELQSASRQKRNGCTTDMFEFGSTIYIVGSPDRTDPTTCYMSEITFENGVIATRHSTFDEGWINAPLGDAGPGGPGGPSPPSKNSTDLVVTERFTLNDDGTELTRAYTLDDPANLEAPIEGSDTVTLTSDAYEAYACDDLTEERSELRAGGPGAHHCGQFLQTYQTAAPLPDHLRGRSPCACPLAVSAIVIARTAALPPAFYRFIAAIGSCWTSRAWTPNKSRAGHSR